MIAAWQKDDVLLEDIRSRQDLPGVDLWWLGQSGYLLRAGNQHLLIDPYLSDSLTKKYASTDKPHVRISERVIDPERLDFIDILTSSHAHTDHLDPETLGPLFRLNPGLRFIVPASIVLLAAERAGIDKERPIGLDAGERIGLEGFLIHAIPSAHNSLDKDVDGRHLYLGYVIETCGIRIYHSGDTLLYPGMEDLLRPLQVDLALLPINGNRPERRVAGNLDPGEAVWLASAIGAGLTIPCHYDMFAFNTADVGVFEREAERAGIGYRVLRLGERCHLAGA
ncbi:MAG: MBL fold metallo-hydrolase [Chitinophagia bacterium]|nr:MBL fold metallo-hydrolase [Chitinophagia bacterium]